MIITKIAQLSKPGRANGINPGARPKKHIWPSAATPDLCPLAALCVRFAVLLWPPQHQKPKTGGSFNKLKSTFIDH